MCDSVKWCDEISFPSQCSVVKALFCYEIWQSLLPCFYPCVKTGLHLSYNMMFFCHGNIVLHAHKQESGIEATLSIPACKIGEISKCSSGTFLTTN